MPRTFRHWTPRYIVNRLAVAYHQRVAPDDPWLTKTACAFLDDWLTPSDVGLEWGCGRSTLWFAKRVAKLTSVEHNPQWYSFVCSRLMQQEANNVDLRFASVETPCGGAGHSYVSVEYEFDCESLDFVLVDGQFRSECAAAALKLIKPGGILILDNAQWYIPHASRSPGALARTGAAIADRWKPVVAELDAWRSVWTSNGVWDTAIYCKPMERSVADASSSGSHQFQRAGG